MWSGIPLLVAFSSFATAALTMSVPLTSEVIFPSISLFMLLQFPLAMVSQVMSNIVESIVSVKRLSSFLKADEVQPEARNVVLNPDLRVGDEVTGSFLVYKRVCVIERNVVIRRSCPSGRANSNGQSWLQFLLFGM
jgi:hypothetical protein